MSERRYDPKDQLRMLEGVPRVRQGARARGEGVIAKDAQSPYTSGRSSRWIKIKTDIGEDRERKRRP